MSTFYYAPQTTSVSDMYNHQTMYGKNMDVLDASRVAQFKRDTDNAFGAVQVALNYHTSKIQILQSQIGNIQDENLALRRMLVWVQSHYPEAMHALNCTMKVHAVLDKANQTDDVMESP